VEFLETLDRWSLISVSDVPMAVWYGLIPLAVLSFALIITAVISIVKKPLPTNDKLLWLLLSIFATPIGPVLYFAIGSAQLDQKISQKEKGDY